MERIAVDILMVITIILEFVSLPIMLHQVLGIGLLFLIIYHIKLHKNYFKAIFKGKYNLKRAIDLIINIGLLISLLVTIISGIFCSRESWKSIKVGNFSMSHIHKSSAVISLVFLVLHLISTHKKLFREIKKIK
ncbi:DUF4405 domain-containing protein [uncultured Methanobrevibacter sp.]|uniref:DUF4405 domain-containing protein n=1 Tax=uncultured Methanobrevibacter sp. TaxID=253161 RepID=UPI0025F0122D|nr:DUF4405 domain-containing protein [uncultured Methanobrevibacter sp.]